MGSHMVTKERMRSMNVGIIAPPFLKIESNMSGYGGTERVVAELARGLVERGHNVTLFAPNGSRIDAEVNMVSVGEALWDRKKKFKVTQEEIADGIKNTLDVAYNNASKLEVLHSHIDESLDDERFDGIAILNTIHGDTASMKRYAGSNHRPLAFISKSQERLMLGFGSKDGAPTTLLNSMGIVYNGININGMNASYAPGKYLVFLGRVSQEKGMHIALEVAGRTNTEMVAMYREPIMNKKDPIANMDWRYYEQQVKPRLEKYNGLIKCVINPKVEVRDEILRGALALVGPSGAPPSTWAEPFGLFVVEAMASGTPAIVYNKGGPVEIVQHGKTGFVARSTDEEGVISEMSEYVYKVREAGVEMRLSSRRRTEEEFSTEKMTEGYNNAYLKVLDYMNYKKMLRTVVTASGFIFSTILGIPKNFTEPTTLLNTATSPSGTYMRDMFYQQFITNLRVLSMISSQELPYIIGAGICLSIYLYRDMSVRARHSFN